MIPRDIAIYDTSLAYDISRFIYRDIAICHISLDRDIARSRDGELTPLRVGIKRTQLSKPKDRRSIEPKGRRLRTEDTIQFAQLAKRAEDVAVSVIYCF